MCDLFSLDNKEVLIAGIFTLIGALVSLIGTVIYSSISSALRMKREKNVFIAQLVAKKILLFKTTKKAYEAEKNFDAFTKMLQLNNMNNPDKDKETNNIIINKLDSYEILNFKYSQTLNKVQEEFVQTVFSVPKISRNKEEKLQKYIMKIFQTEDILVFEKCTKPDEVLSKKFIDEYQKEIDTKLKDLANTLDSIHMLIVGENIKE
jgi:GTPase involved in cell partitioning and DNA repair